VRSQVSKARSEAPVAPWDSGVWPVGCSDSPYLKGETGGTQVPRFVRGLRETWATHRLAKALALSMSLAISAFNDSCAKLTLR